MAAGLTPQVNRPSDLPPKEMDEFVAFVREAGKVTSKGLPRRIRQADFLVRKYDGHTLIGTAAIKVPDEGYPRSVFTKANVERHVDSYPRELGYVHVHEDHQSKGYSLDLAEAAVSAAHGQALFATTTSERMGKTLKRLGFTVLGEPYVSEEDETAMLRLFVRGAAG